MPNFNADAALTLRKKRGFSVCSVAGSRSRDYQSNPHFQCGIALSVPAVEAVAGKCLPRHLLSLGSRLAEPERGLCRILFDALAKVIAHAKAELRLRVPLLGGLAEPGKDPDMVLCGALALPVAAGKLELRLRIALPGGLAVPVGGLVPVPRHAAAVIIAVAEFTLCRGVVP